MREIATATGQESVLSSSDVDGQRLLVLKLLSQVSEKLECAQLIRTLFHNMHWSPAKLQINLC